MYGMFIKNAFHCRPYQDFQNAIAQCLWQGDYGSQETN